MPRVGNPEQRRRTFIKEWRLYRDLTQQKLADRLETTKTTISELETGKRGYTQESLEAVADALQTDVASLLTRDPKSSENLWSLWDKAKPGQRRQIIEITQTLLKTGT